MTTPCDRNRNRNRGRKDMTMDVAPSSHPAPSALLAPMQRLKAVAMPGARR